VSSKYRNEMTVDPAPRGRNCSNALTRATPRMTTDGKLRYSTCYDFVEITLHRGKP